MMTTIGGQVSSALTHLAAYGLGNILEDAGADRVRVWWQNLPGARAKVCSNDELDHAQAVLTHARRHLEPDSWVQQTKPRLGRPTGLFSPRIKAATTTAEWDEWQQAREQVLDDPSLTALDHRMIGALGEPAYWHWAAKNSQPDRGASRWEMKTRNRGEEFVGNRLALLARTVAAREVDRVRSGIDGSSLEDEAGKNSADSRSGTGLTRPGPVDNALSWCALWGIASLALVPRSDAFSQTAGAYPRTRVHPDRYGLPVITQPKSPALWRRLLASRELDQMLADEDERDRATWRSWRRRWDIGDLYVFPVVVGGSATAPERAIQLGRPWGGDSR